MRFHHIGIFSKDIVFGVTELSKYIEIKKSSEIYEDGLLKVKVQFLYDHDGICYEVVAPYGKDNPVDPVISSGKNILNHLAYKSKEFEEDIDRMRNLGSIPITSPEKALAFSGARVIFFLTPLKIIIEIIEDI